MQNDPFTHIYEYNIYIYVCKLLAHSSSLVIIGQEEIRHSGLGLENRYHQKYNIVVKHRQTAGLL